MPRSSHEVRQGIVIYLLCTFSLSSVFYALIIHAERLAAAGGLYALGLTWCPTAGALMTCWLRRRSLASLGWRWDVGSLAASYALPILYVSIAYTVVWLTGLGGFPNRQFVDSVAADAGLTGLPRIFVLAMYVGVAGSVGMIGAMGRALGEEIGWRGFLVPELAKVTSFTWTALLSGIIWASWYMPIIIFADYNNGTPVLYGATCFAIATIAMSFLLAWMRLRSGSVWTAVLLHASQTVFVQSVFSPLTVERAATPYLIDEFGAALAVCLVVVAAVVWKHRHAVDKRRVPMALQPSPVYAVLLRSTSAPALRGH